MQTVPINESLIIANISKCRELFSAALSGPDTETIFDLSDVDDCDSSGVQLLIAARKHAEDRNTHVRFSSYSDAVLKAFGSVGINNVDEYFSSKE